MLNIGIDLGGTNIAGAIVNEEGKMLITLSVPTLREREWHEIVKDMAQLAIRLIDEAGLTAADIHSVGIGSPGTPDPVNGMIIYSNNLKFKNTPVREEFQKYLNLPVFIENDANAAAFGEFISGAGLEYKDLVMITLGTGVGGGVIVNGKIIGGSYYGGSELGHTVIKAGGEQCSCGRKGCWEAYSSASALIRDASRATENNVATAMYGMVGGDVSKMNAKIVFDAKDQGDETAIQIVNNYIHDLATGLVNMVNIFQPEAIVLGGGVSAQKDKLITPLKAAMLEEIYGGEENFKTVLKTAELGNDAGIVGAANLYKVYEYK